MTVKINNYVKPDDCFQLTLLSLIETAANILIERSEYKSHRYNRIIALKNQLDAIDKSYDGELPAWWVDESLLFNSKLEKLLNDVLKKYRQMDSKPVIIRGANGKFQRVEAT